MKTINYRGYGITYEPKPIPTRSMDYTYIHEDYDGEGDCRIGYAESVEGAKLDIDMEVETEYFIKPKKAPCSLNTQCQNKECFHNDDSESGCESRSFWTLDLCDKYKPQEK